MTYPAPFVQYCDSLGIKLTSLRKEVLYILWQLQRPIKAYEVLDNLLKTKPNSKPPTVYRALIYFVSHGIVHKIDSIQSYTLCCKPEKHLLSEILMVCNHCHQVIEVHNTEIQTTLLHLAEANQFNLKQDVIEIKGICQRCV